MSGPGDPVAQLWLCRWAHGPVTVILATERADALEQLAELGDVAAAELEIYPDTIKTRADKHERPTGFHVTFFPVDRDDGGPHWRCDDLTFCDDLDTVLGSVDDALAKAPKP